MTKKEVEGLKRNPFFVALNPKENGSDYVESVLKDSFKYDGQSNDALYERILYNYCCNNSERCFDKNKDYTTITKSVVLEYLVLVDALQYFCKDEYNDKLIGIINRRQVNAKELRPILNRISFFSIRLQSDFSKLSLVLDNDIRRQFTKFNNDCIVKSLGALKAKIDKIIPGVNLKCYLDYNANILVGDLSKELISAVKEKHGYDLEKYSIIPHATTLAKVLSMAIVNDYSFWKFDYPTRTIIDFITYVDNYNGPSYAEKIIDYAFDIASNDSKLKRIFDLKMPVHFYDIEGEMIDFAITRINVGIGKQNNLLLTEEEKKGLIYPIYQGYEKSIEEGKRVFYSFIEDSYPNDNQNVLELFKDVENVIQDARAPINGVGKLKTTIHQMLEFELLGFDEAKLKETYLSTIYPGYESQENIIARFYYRLYIIKKYTNEKYLDYIYEYLYTILKMIEIKYGYKSKHTMDNKLRDERFNVLKQVLSKRGISISDEYKALYIIALLDRKYASYEESKQFAELEQYGDAIYELAVDNIIFYDRDHEVELNHQAREKYVNADAQVLISKKIGLNDAYISKLNDASNEKYTRNELYEEGIYNKFSGHFLADSLEMVIAVVAKEFGIQTALEFTTNIILET